MDRRRFLAGIPALLVASAHAQPVRRAGPLPRVGIFLTGPLKTPQRHHIGSFFAGMRELGWIEGSNLIYEHGRHPARDLYSPDDDAEMVAIAQELVDRKPDVIWLLSSISVDALKDVNRHIPVVGAAVSDVVGRKLAQSLAHPGKNFTGISNFTWELGGKRFQFLREFMPRLSRVGVLTHPTNRNCIRELEMIEKAAKPLRVTVIPAMMQREEQAESAFAHLAQQRAQAVLITHFPLFQSSRKLILKLAADRGIPAVGHRTYFAEDGALLAYSTVLEEQMRRSAHLVDKILKGARPGDLPVEQPTRFELVLNSETARANRLPIPDSLRYAANRII